ncbi:MAG: IS200/IS605 family transposase [bacterium]
MSEHIFKRHNKNLLMYHLVFPAKYRKKIFSSEIDKTLKEICIELSQNYEILFLEIGTDQDHVHFLVQSVPILSVTKIVTIIKSITAKQLFILHPEIKKKLWGGNIWTSGYYANTVGRYGNETIISNYVKNQGKNYTYKQQHRSESTDLFEDIF